MAYHRNFQPFMILPTQLKYLEEEYKKLWIALQNFDRATFDKLSDLPLTHARDSANNTVLHHAASVGNADCLAYLLKSFENRPGFDAINFAGHTALQIGLMNISVSRADHNLREVVRVLLEAGDDPRLPQGMTNGLMTTAQVMCPTTVYRIYCSMLHREPSKIHLMKRLRDSQWSIRHFVWTKDLQLLKLLLNYDSSILKSNLFYSEPPLHQAVEARAPPAVFELMLCYDLDINAPALETMNTPLHRLCELSGEWNNAEVVEMLLAAGANPNLRNSKRRNCLHAAARTGSEPVVNALLKYNVAINDWDTTGKNAMHYAALSGNVKVLSNLVSLGMSVFEPCRSDVGATALHLASRYCRPETVAYLMNQGLHPNITDFKNKTPLHYAVRKQASNLERRCTETVDTLVDYGGHLFDETLGGISILRYCIQNNYLHNASIIMRHLALDQSKDLKDKEFYLRMIRSDKLLQEAYDSCIAELELMKKFEVYGWVTMYKILTSPDMVLKPLMRNPEFVIKMNSCIIGRLIYSKFPIYCTRIINRYTVMEKEQRRIKKASQGLSHLIGYGDASGEIIGTIIKYLEPSDIDTLVQHRLEMTAESLLSFRLEMEMQALKEMKLN